MKSEDLPKMIDQLELPPPPKLIELGTVRELVRGNGSGGFDSADACASPGEDVFEPPNC